MCVPGLSSEDPEVAKVLADRRRLVATERERIAADPEGRARSEAALQEMVDQAEAEGWYDDPALNGPGPSRH